MARIMPLFRREQSLAQLYIDIPALRPGTIGAYLLAFVSVGLATALRLAIDPYVHGLQFATFLPAVIITTLISGLGAGLFSVVLSVAAAAFFALPPGLTFYVDEPGDVLAPPAVYGGYAFQRGHHYRDAFYSRAQTGPGGRAGKQRSSTACPQCSPPRVVAGSRLGAMPPSL
jgi:hypothetical protein